MSTAAAATTAQDNTQAGQAASTTEPAKTEATGAQAPAAEPAKSEAAPAATPEAGKVEPEKKDPQAKETEAKGAVVPEKYDLKLPEGSQLQASALEGIAAYAKAQGLSQEQAQGLVERESKAIAAFAEGQTQQLEAAKKAWAETLVKDPEIGGEALKENAELSKRVIAKFATPEFMQTLENSGLGNHPELTRVFVRIGKAMGEDKLVVPNGSGASQGEVRAADILYGKTTT